MKVYVAGKFEEIDLIRSIYARLTEAGHEVAYDWTTHVKSKPYSEHVERIKQYATNELTAILDADVLIYLSHERGTTLHMELGVAIAKAASNSNIKIFVVGEHNERSPWYFLPCVTRVGAVEEVLAAL